MRRVPVERLRPAAQRRTLREMSHGGVVMRRSLVWPCVVGMALAAGGCGGAPDEAEPAAVSTVSTTSSPTPSPESPAPSEPVESASSAAPTPSEPDGSVSPGPTSFPTAGPSAAPTEQSTASRSVAPPAQVIRVTGVEVRDEGGAEQLVVSFEGGVPGWSAQYVDFVRIDSDPVVVDGAVALELILTSADPTGEQGLADEVAVSLYPELDLIREVRYVYYLGDEITYAVGMAEQAEFSVETTADSLVFSFVGS